MKKRTIIIFSVVAIAILVAIGLFMIFMPKIEQSTITGKQTALTPEDILEKNPQETKQISQEKQTNQKLPKRA